MNPSRTTIAPFTTGHWQGVPLTFRKASVPPPSKSTMASEGGLPGVVSTILSCSAAAKTLTDMPTWTNHSANLAIRILLPLLISSLLLFVTLLLAVATRDCTRHPQLSAQASLASTRSSVLVVCQGGAFVGSFRQAMLDFLAFGHLASTCPVLSGNRGAAAGC